MRLVKTAAGKGWERCLNFYYCGFSDRHFIGRERGKPPTNHPHWAVPFWVHYIDNWSLRSAGKTNLQSCSLAIPVFSCCSSPASIKIQAFLTSFLFLTNSFFLAIIHWCFLVYFSLGRPHPVLCLLWCGAFAQLALHSHLFLANHPPLLLASCRINVFFFFKRHALYKCLCIFFDVK